MQEALLAEVPLHPATFNQQCARWEKNQAQREWEKAAGNSKLLIASLPYTNSFLTELLTNGKNLQNIGRCSGSLQWSIII